jgi:hypothetical protein
MRGESKMTLLKPVTETDVVKQQNTIMQTLLRKISDVVLGGESAWERGDLFGAVVDLRKRAATTTASLKRAHLRDAVVEATRSEALDWQVHPRLVEAVRALKTHETNPEGT